LDAGVLIVDVGVEIQSIGSVCGLAKQNNWRD